MERPTINVSDLYEFLLRYAVASRAMAYDLEARLVCRFVARNNTGWRRKTLADRLNIPARTASRRVDALIAAGMLEIRDGLIYCTEMGKRRIEQSHIETTKLAMGDADQYSEDLRAFVSGLPDLANVDGDSGVAGLGPFKGFSVDYDK